MKLGIIGAGKIVEEFLPGIAGIDGVTVMALLGTRRSKERVEKLCRDNNIAHISYDFMEFCTSDIDTVYVAVPNSLHYEYCKKALDAGLNVIVEKPLASNYVQVKELIELAVKKKLLLFEAITTIYLPAFEKIRSWLRDIGSVKLVSCNFSQYSSRYDAFLKGNIMPAFDPAKSGGALMDLNIYNLYFVMGLFGPPQKNEYFANIDREIDTSGVLVLKYPGFTASCIAAKDSSAPYYFVIEGTKGYIMASAPPNSLGKVILHLNNNEEEYFDDGLWKCRYKPEFEAFVKHIDNKELEICYNYLELSLSVSRILTQSRLGAGIMFPKDNIFCNETMSNKNDCK